MGLPQAGVELVAKGLSSFVSDTKKAGDAVQSFGNDAKKAADGVKSFGDTVQKTSDLYQDAEGRWRTASGRFASNAEKAAAGVETIKPAVKGASDAVDKAGHSFDAFGEIVTGALRKIGELGIEALMKAGQAVTGFVKDSVSVAGDFQAGMLEFQAVAGKSVDTKGLEQFHDLFIQLGKELPVSTSEVQQAAIEMVSGGIDPAIVAAGALRQNIQFAAAANLSLADAAATSAKFLAGWTDPAASAADKVAFLTSATNDLTKAAAASSTTAAELRLGIFNVQGAAQALHAPFEDVVATLAKLAPAFESSAQAGTALNVFMTRLVPSTNPATDAMKALGIITKTNQNLFFDTKGNFLGMANAAQVLKDHMGGLSDEQKINQLHTIFGNDAMKVGNLLMQEGAAGLEAIKAKMAEANGVSEQAALKQQGYNTALENAKGSVEALQITVGEKLLPVLTDFLNNIVAPGVNTLTTMADAIFGNKEAFDQLSPTLQTIVGIVQATVAEFSHLADAFQAGGLSTLIDTLITDIGAALPDIESALIEWGQALVDWIAPYIPPMLDALGAAVDDAWAWVEEQTPGWIAQLGAWGEALGEWVAPYIPVILDALGDLVDQAWTWIKGQAPGWGQQLLTWGQKLVDWVTPMVGPALDALGDLAAQLWGWIKDQAGVLLNKLGDWAKAFVEWIPGATVKFLAEWPGMLDKFLDWIGDSAGPLLKQLGTWAVQFVEWIVPMIPKFLVALGGVALALATFVGETAVVLVLKLKAWAEAMIGWVGKEVLPKLPGILLSFWTTMNTLLTDIGVKIGLAMREAGAKLVAGLQAGIANAWSSFTGWVHSKIMELPEAVRTALGIHSPSTVFAELGELSVMGYLSGWQAKLPEVMTGVQSVGAQITSSMSPIIDDLMGLGLDAMAGFGAGLQRGVRSVVKIVNSTSKTVVGAFNDALGAHSPATTMIPTGQSVVQGLMEGMAATLPALTTLIDSIATGMIDALKKNKEEMGDQIRQAADDLIDQARSLAEDINSAIADGFGATASIDRQLAKNLDKFKDVLPEYASYTQGALKQAEQTARKFLDPTEGAKYFKMRSDQIFEYAKLQKDLAEAETQADKERITAQMQLINAAQIAEISESDARQQAQRSPIQQIADTFQQIMNNKDIALPGILDNPIIAQLSELIRQLQQPMATPPASAQMIYGGSGNTSYTSQRTYNMPVYTNNTPAVLQQSLAIIQAGMA